MKQQSILDDQKIQELANVIEEATRSSKSGVKYFVEPAQGVLSRAVSKRHHIIFGRRGSGKSSLLIKLASDASLQRLPVVFVDMEEFKGHSYPDVLVSVLIKVFQEFEEWLNTTAINPATKKSFWSKWFGGAPKKGALNRVKAGQLAATVGRYKAELNSLLFDAAESSDKATVQKTAEMTAGVSANIGAGLKSPLAESSMGMSYDESESQKKAVETTQEYRSFKIEKLHRKILDFKDLLQQLSEYSGGHGYILLDDLYHIRTSDQADVIDYFHRICKGTGMWLKIGTIRHRTRYYVGGDPPRGMKIGDDADDIDLDVTLEKYQITKRFLLKILEQFTAEYGYRLDDIVTDGARDRLVLASGGVARDYLTSFRRSIGITRERLAKGVDSRGPKIGAEDVNVAAGENDSNKREEFNKDAATAEQQNLMTLFARIRTFCIETNNSNCFLIEKEYRGTETAGVGELVDLKFVHHVSSRVTVRSRKGRVYDAYMLDLSQYTGERARRNLNMIEIWDSTKLDSLRKPKLILFENQAT